VRQLHFVGTTDDHTGLIVAEQRGGRTLRYLLAVTDDLRAALEPAPLPAAARRDETTSSRRDETGYRRDETAAAGRPRSSRLNPREIQARLRMGRSIGDVAAEAGVDLEWVERWAGPILAEQQAALARAKRLTFHTPRRGPSARPLGGAVVRNLLDKGMRVSEDDSGWSAWLHQGTEWVVAFRYVVRGHEVVAEWIADLAAGSLVALNRPAMALAFIPTTDLALPVAGGAAPQTGPLWPGPRSDPPSPPDEGEMRRPRRRAVPEPDSNQPRLPGVGS
jgi:Protein of unknown function (DUF3071)